MGADEEPQTQRNPNSNHILTRAQFQSWKQQKDAETLARKAEAARKRAEDIAAGVVQMTGRELFLHEPEVFDNSRF